jgi:predicted dehydrogenase
MKQVTQRPRDGSVSVDEVPEPAVRPGWVLVRNRYSLLSAGTERRKIELGQKNLVQKARARPDLARKLVDRARVEGVRSAVEVARDRLEARAAIGYSCAGTVIRVGAGTIALAPGQLVACAGAGWANHAEVVAVPANLVAIVPDSVDLMDASYATVGAIALHAVRQSEATIGERVGIIGLGLVGQLAVRILSAAGCEVVGIDPDPAAVALASEGGAEGFSTEHVGLEPAVRSATAGLGLDAVLVCAASGSAAPLELAARLARERGRVVVVGDVPIALDRELLYEKELELRVSRSYGPGRYDVDYEVRGRDLPAGYVRWTEQRNLQAFVDLVAAGRVSPAALTTHRLPVERAADAYAALSSGGGGTERAFGVVLEYASDAAPAAEPRMRPSPQRRPKRAAVGVGLIGAGSFARGTLLPALRSDSTRLVSVASQGGLSAADVAGRFGFDSAASSADDVLADDDVDAVVIATRHADHASLTAAALRAGKSVFVEKPLALTYEQLLEVQSAISAEAVLVVGFNRRFAPLTEQLRGAVPDVPDRVLCVRVNAGPLPANHWLHDPEDGGGRLLGEGCHFVDLLIHLAGHPATEVHAFGSPQPERPLECSDSLTATLRFADGSVGSLLYAGTGNARLPKERVEVFGAGVAAVLDDFRRLEIFRSGGRSTTKQAQDKGHRAEVAHFLAMAAGRLPAEPADSYLHATRATLAMVDSLRDGRPTGLG